VRFREDKPGDLDRARAAVAEWREQNPAGSREQMLTALSAGFHRDYGPVLGAVLSVHDRDHARQITAHPAATGPDHQSAHDGGQSERTGPAQEMT
jgi:hypothetical protein